MLASYLWLTLAVRAWPAGDSRLPRLPRLRGPATRPHPEVDKSSPHPHTLFNIFLILSAVYA
jgi:hypothetical protein